MTSASFIDLYSLLLGMGAALGGALGIFLLISLVLYSVAWIGGWRNLAEAYPGKPQLEGGTWRFSSLEFGYWARYGNCVTLGGDREGLHLSMIWVFKAGHAPIFVPWSEIWVAGRSSFVGFFPKVALGFRKLPVLRLWISADLLREIQEAVKALGPRGGENDVLA